MKTTLAVYLIFYKLMIFESLIFLEPTIKPITEIFDLQKQQYFSSWRHNCFFLIFFSKKIHTLMP